MLSGLREQIRGADEAYLTALANKGLYKRALRELPGAGAAVQWGGQGELAVTFGDGTVVKIEEAIGKYTCSCPSRSVCKHLLMAVLAAQQQAGEEAQEEGPAAPPDFSPLADTSLRQLEKLGGKKAVQDAVFRLSLGLPVEIEEGNLLRVDMEENGQTVLFLPGAPLEEASCSCKSASFCAHRVLAVLHLIVKSKGALPPEFLPGDSQPSLEYSTVALDYVEEFLVEVFVVGLARLPEGTASRFRQLATICHGQRLANMERLCSRIAGQLEQMAAKSATFRRDYLIADLCRLSQLCAALQNGAEDRETVGVFREQYRPLPTVELRGLGAYQWRSTGGYAGVTVLLYCTERKTVFTYTAALPDGDGEKLYHSGAPWKVPTKLAALSHARFQLRGGKASGKNQLSASDAAAALMQGATDIADPALSPIIFDDFSLLLDALWERGEEEGVRSVSAIVTPARYGAGQYDDICQELCLPVYDQSERRLNLLVKYEACTALLIENLKWMEEKEQLAGPLLVRVSLAGGVLSAFPITHYGSMPVNLSLDREKKRDKRKSAIEWDF